MSYAEVELLEDDHGIRLYRTANGFAVIRPWRAPRHVIALFIGLAIAAVALSLYYHNVRATRIYAPWWLVGTFALVVIYYAITGINKTTIRISTDCVEVTRGPFPVLGGRRRKCSALKAVNVRFDRVITARGGVADVYVVEGTVAGGRTIVLDLVPDARKANVMAEQMRTALSQLGEKVFQR